MKLRDIYLYPLNLVTAVHCGAPPPIENGYLNSTTGITFGTLATYICHDGYVMSNTITSCTDNGEWSPLPVCQGM